MLRRTCIAASIGVAVLTLASPSVAQPTMIEERIDWSTVPGTVTRSVDPVVALSGDGQRMGLHVHAGVIVFRRAAGTWVYEDRIADVESDANPNFSFGEEMHFSHDGSVLLVVATNPYRWLGRMQPVFASIFRRTGSDWAFEDTITTRPEIPRPYLGYIGGGLSSDGRRAVVVINGALRTFDLGPGGWALGADVPTPGAYQVALSSDGMHAFAPTPSGILPLAWSSGAWAAGATFASPSYPLAFSANRAGTRVAVTESVSSVVTTRVFELDAGAWAPIAELATPGLVSMRLADAGSALVYSGTRAGLTRAPTVVSERYTGWGESVGFSYTAGPVTVPIDRMDSVSLDADGIVFAMTGNGERVFRAERGLGADCNRAAECLSGYCVANLDGAAFCCDAPCEGACAHCGGGHCRSYGGGVCRPSLGECDAAETCVEGSLDCPVDAVVAAGMRCRDAVGECDVAEACDGSAAACPADELVAAGAECRSASGVCDVAERCTGSDAACPADAARADGSSCSDPGRCDGESLCASGACVPGTPVACDDGDACTADVCDTASGACATSAIADCCHVDDECDDGDPCTRDACRSNACEHADACVDAGARDAGVRVDGGRREDAGPRVDAGQPVDAALAMDGGIRPAVTRGGCACRAGTGASPPSAIGAMVAVLAGVVIRRARRVGTA